MEKFLIVKDVFKKVRRFNLHGRTMEFRLKPVPEDVEPVGWVRDAINQVVTKAMEDVQPEDKVGITFCSKEFSRGDGWMRFRRAGDITSEDIWDVISSIYQSNSSGLNTESFCLGVTSVRMPSGSGRGKNYNTFDEECLKRRGIIAIRNKDNMCLPRALVVAIALVEKSPEYQYIRKDFGKLQTKRALELLNKACVAIPEGGAGIPELQQFQKYLKDYKITVYNYGSKGRDVIFEGEADSDKRLNLLHHENHFNVITSLTAVFCCNYFCEKCNMPYDHKNKHRCGGVCVGCQRSPPCLKETTINCSECLRNFRSEKCFENHKETICASVRRCSECLKTVKSGRNHVCGEIFCHTCNKHQPKDHFCYMQVDAGCPKTNNLLMIFYDLETMQQKIVKENVKLHEPNICVYSQRCDTCINEVNLYFCQKCGFRTKVIKENVIKSFVDYVFSMRKKFASVVVLAHNGQAFDHQFILNYILTQTDLTPQLITRGTKLLLLQIENIKFLD